MSNKHDLPLRLRMACDKIRRTSMPIKDLVPMMHEAADAIQRLEAENEAMQAKIDALMLEFCPGEMTAEQLERWASHQKAALTTTADNQ